MFRDFPVLGVGLGAVEYAFPYYKLSGVPAADIVQHVHSDWLELFLQVGVAGGFIYLAGLLASLYFLFRGWVQARSFTIKSLCGGALWAVAAASIHNLMEFGSQMPANALIYYVLLGALASRPAVAAIQNLATHDEIKTEEVDWNTINNLAHNKQVDINS